MNAVKKGDYQTALSILEDLANKGDVEAQTYLGYMYNYGNGVQQDYKKAFELFEKASNQGDAKAQTFLGYMYEYGEGVEQNYKKAFELFQKSAKQPVKRCCSCRCQWKLQGRTCSGKL